MINKDERERYQQYRKDNPITTKNNQIKEMRQLADLALVRFEKRYPTKTIGGHHYVRRRHLQNFLYEFGQNILEATNYENYARLHQDSK